MDSKTANKGKGRALDLQLVAALKQVRAARSRIAAQFVHIRIHSALRRGPCGRGQASSTNSRQRKGEYFSSQLQLFGLGTITIQLTSVRISHKQHIAECCYAITNGCWRDCLVKFAYDPRKDKESRL